MSWFYAFAGFAALIVLHEAGHFLAAKAVGMRVERFSLFFPPLLLRKKVGETEYAIGALPLGGYVKITGMNPSEELPDELRTRAYYSQPVWKRIVVIFAGPLMNFILALLLLWAFFAFVGPRDVSEARIGEITPGFPAAGVLQQGDRLIAVDSQRGEPAELSRLIAAHTCPERPPTAGCRAAEPALITIERDGEVRTLELTPVYDPQTERTRVGFGFEFDRAPLAAGAAVGESLDRFWFISKETLKLPARLLDREQREEITGVVGSYETTRQTILGDAEEVIGILAIISLSLAIVNLFPFLPLDGGHIFWAVVEKLRRRPVSFEVMERSGVIGFALVIGLFMIGLTNDIDRLQNEGFDFR